MPHHDASSADCRVFTHREGILSALGHDLEIRVARFQMALENGSELSVRATFDASSLQVVTALYSGVPRADALSNADKRKIEENIRDEVLHVGRYPEILLVSTHVTPAGDGYRIAGNLTLHGRTRALVFDARPEAERFVAEITLHQPDFGITPYSAMLGAIKVKPDVTIRCSVPRWR